MVFVLDNYDSFTYNLVQYLGELGAEEVRHGVPQPPVVGRARNEGTSPSRNRPISAGENCRPT